METIVTSLNVLYDDELEGNKGLSESANHCHRNIKRLSSTW